MRSTLLYTGTPESAFVESDCGQVIENVVGYFLERKDPLGENELVVRIRIPRASECLSNLKILVLQKHINRCTANGRLNSR